MRLSQLHEDASLSEDAYREAERNQFTVRDTDQPGIEYAHGAIGRRPRLYVNQEFFDLDPDAKRDVLTRAYDGFLERGNRRFQIANGNPDVVAELQPLLAAAGASQRGHNWHIQRTPADVAQSGHVSEPADYETLRSMWRATGQTWPSRQVETGMAKKLTLPTATAGSGSAYRRAIAAGAPSRIEDPYNLSRAVAYHRRVMHGQRWPALEQAILNRAVTYQASGQYGAGGGDFAKPRLVLFNYLATIKQPWPEGEQLATNFVTKLLEITKKARATEPDPREIWGFKNLDKEDQQIQLDMIRRHWEQYNILKTRHFKGLAKSPDFRLFVQRHFRPGTYEYLTGPGTEDEEPSFT